MGTATDRPAITSDRMIIFLASALGLFLELALIRWVSCEVRIFAYFKNMILIACFLGFGSGCLLYRRRVHLLQASWVLLLVCMLLRLPWQPLLDYGPRRISLILAEMPGLMIFRSYDALLSAHGIAGMAFAITWTVLLFVAMAAIMIPFGQIVASAIAGMPGKPLTAYSINVAGSLTGIMVYTMMTIAELPPICWFVPAVLMLVLLPAATPVRKELLACALGLTLILLPDNTYRETTIWSPYQKLALMDRQLLLVNNIWFQRMIRQPVLGEDSEDVRTASSFPYRVYRPAGKVLVLGAGTGNDVAAALGAGAESVIAVEIDPVIVGLGRSLHPQKPYDDPRVTVIVDDARHFLKTAEESFNLIVFGVLDSHTTLSSFTNVRLDDYMYTVESLRDARKRLSPGGMLSISFNIEQTYIAERIGRNLTEAFGHEPVSLFGPPTSSLGWRLAFFCTGESHLMPRIETEAVKQPSLVRFSTRSSTVVPSTDDWPFLPLSSPQIPTLVLILSAIVVVLCGAFVLKARPVGEPFRARVFWLGAAFMLLEVHNVSRLALCFGTTWQVNAWVIGMILSVILLANWICMRVDSFTRSCPRWVVLALFGSLAVSYFAPLAAFLEYSTWLGGFAATLLLTLPIFFAAIIFAAEFASSSASGFALGWNILGGVVGGMTESVSYAFGIPSLVLVASVFYLLAVLSPASSSASPVTAGHESKTSSA